MLIQNDDLRLAGVTLVALSRAAQSDQASELSAFSISGSKPMPFDKAEDHLAAMPKPMACTARAVNGVLVVGTRSMDQPDDFVYLQALRDSILPADIEIILEHARGGAPRILVAGGDTKKCLLSVEEYACWRTSYDLEDTSFAFVEADEETRRLGASLLMEFGRQHIVERATKMARSSGGRS